MPLSRDMGRRRNVFLLVLLGSYFCFLSHFMVKAGENNYNRYFHLSCLFGWWLWFLGSWRYAECHRCIHISFLPSDARLYYITASCFSLHVNAFSYQQ